MTRCRNGRTPVEGHQRMRALELSRRSREAHRERIRALSEGMTTERVEQLARSGWHQVGTISDNESFIITNSSPLQFVLPQMPTSSNYTITYSM